MNTKAKRCFRLIAVFLCVSLLLNLNILPVHAVPGTSEDVLDSATPSQAVDSISPSVSSEEETLQFENAMIYTDPKAGGIREVTELREASVKHFAMTDGSYRAVSYASPVHRKDANGVWQNIDNRLSLQNVKGTEFYATSDQRTMFAKSFTANTPVFLLSENDYMIGMAFVSNQLDASESVTPMGAPTITNAAERVETTYYDTLEEASAIDNRSSITYANIKANTDLEYVLIGNDVKENIVVKSPGTRYEYTFMLGLIGLHATLEASGDIAMTDMITGERKYTIPAPFMYDASGEVSRDVAYTLNTNADGSYTLKITASTAWINAEGRTFPVKIDPSVLVEMPEMDTYMDVNYPEDVNGTSATLTVSSDATAYIKLAMPSLPSDAEITSATLYTKKYSASGSVYVSARRVTGYWSESTPGAGAPYYSATTLDSATISPYSGTVASFDITSAATAWDSGTANYGIALVGESEYIGDYALLESMETWTIDGNDDATGSYMIIYYTQYIPDGVYAFESTYDDSDMWLTVKNASPIAGERMIQRSASPITQETFANACFFKISRVPNTERYVIRLMTNNCLTFGYEDEQIVTKEIPYNDADVSANDCFYIGWNGESYELIPCNNTDVAIAIDYDGSTYITTGTPYSSDSTAGWQLVQYTGNSIDGVSKVVYSDELFVGDNYDYDVCMYSSTIGRNGPVTYSVSGTDNSTTDKVTIDSSTGLLQTEEPGEIFLRVTYSGAPWTWSWEIAISVLPCSGYEIAYLPSLWNDSLALKNSNCYNYALNILNTEGKGGVNYFLQPGRRAGYSIEEFIFNGTLLGYPWYISQLKNGTQIQENAIADATELGITFTPIGKNDVCPEGTYKIALVLDLTDDPLYTNNRKIIYTEEGDYVLEYPDTDYHWYRQNPDGTWSHKPGPTEVINYDASGEIIYDPQICDRDYGYIDYSIFVGYYAVSCSS